jgi:hypothetical protein
LLSIGIRGCTEWLLRGKVDAKSAMAKQAEAADARYRLGKHPSCCCFRCMVETPLRASCKPFQPLQNEFLNYRSSMISMINGMGIPTSQRRIGISFLLSIEIRLFVYDYYLARLRPQVPSRRPPPSVAAKAAENAPINKEAASQNAS